MVAASGAPNSNSDGGHGAGQGYGQGDGHRLLEHLDRSPLALIEWDTEFRIVRWSKRAEAIFGWKAAEVEGLHFGDFRFVHEADLKEVKAAAFELANGLSETCSVRNRNYTRDGKIVECSWHNSVMASAENGRATVLSLVLDESLNRRTLEQLRIQNERLEFTLAAAEMGLWDLDLSTGYVSCLGTMEKLLGYAPGEFPGNFDAAIRHFSAEHRLQQNTALENVMKNGGTFEADLQVHDPRTGLRWIRTRGRVFYDDQNRAVRMAGTAVDITANRRVEDEVREAKKSAENASAHKSAFLANMSHEIRTPLGVLLGFSDLLSDPDLNLNDRIEFTKTVARNGRHLSRLVDDILDLSKVEAGRLEVHRSELDFPAAMTEVIGGLKPKAAEKKVRLRAEIDARVPRLIETDPLRLKQIVTNLLANALKFTSEGEIVLRADCETHGANEKLLRIQVEDSGIGISESGRKQLFEPFVQAERNTHKQFGGTGLGLALSRELARALGGDVILKSSEPGRGSVFEITLLVGERRAEEKSEGKTEVAPPQPAALSVPLVAQPLKGLRILLAEDTVDNQILMQRLLTKRGADLVVASDGEEAMRHAIEGGFHIVLMDIQMPKVDGYEATRRLRARDVKIPILALTAHAMISESRKCLEAGCDAHLSKPVRAEELVDAILRLTSAALPGVVQADGVGIVGSVVPEIQIHTFPKSP